MSKLVFSEVRYDLLSSVLSFGQCLPSLEEGYVRILIWTLEPIPPVGDEIFEGLDCMPMSSEQHGDEGTRWQLLLDSSLEMNWCMAEVHVFGTVLADKCQSSWGGEKMPWADGPTVNSQGWQVDPFHGDQATMDVPHGGVQLVEGWPSSHVILWCGHATWRGLMGEKAAVQPF